MYNEKIWNLSNYAYIPTKVRHQNTMLCSDVRFRSFRFANLFTDVKTLIAHSIVVFCWDGDSSTDPRSANVGFRAWTEPAGQQVFPWGRKKYQPVQQKFVQTAAFILEPKQYIFCYFMEYVLFLFATMIFSYFIWAQNNHRSRIHTDLKYISLSYSCNV